MNDASDQGDWVCFEGPYNDGRVENFGGQVGSLSQSLSVQFSKLTVLSFFYRFSSQKGLHKQLWSSVIIKCLLLLKKANRSKAAKGGEEEEATVVIC